MGIDGTRRQHQQEEEALQLVVPNRILVVQLGTDEDEAKVFRAHAAPQGLCETHVRASTSWLFMKQMVQYRGVIVT